MSAHSNTYELQQRERAGRLLANRLHEARSKRGLLRCPVCQKIFEATHLIKCPVCRTLIGKTFREVRSPASARKMELDFFAAPLNVGEERDDNGDGDTSLLTSDDSNAPNRQSSIDNIQLSFNYQE